MSFQHLNLIEPLLKALEGEGYTTPTPIQQQAIPLLLERKDLLGCAQTGTGKTAAFALPILQLLCEDAAGVTAETRTGGSRPIRALVLTPTRELAIQIGDSFAAYGRHTGMKHLVIFGGVPQQPQVHALQRGTDILVATPGRLLDLIDQKYINLQNIKYFVLDEADRMLDMGFIHDVRKVLTKLPAKRHSLFFSATMPPEIQKLADAILVNPAKVEVTPVSSTAETIQQSIFFVEKKDKRSLLLHILKTTAIPSALVFTRTKHGADKVAQGLVRAGIRAEAIHGNKSQNARQRALLNFKSRQTRILVATDIAARGIDIDELTHVINFELPNVPETYVHRIGRTGRAGANGTALSFCDAEEREFLRDIQKLIAKTIPVVEDHPHVMQAGLSGATVVAAGSGNSSGRNGGRGQQNGGRGQQSGNNNNSRGRGGNGQQQNQGRPPRREQQGGHGKRPEQQQAGERPIGAERPAGAERPVSAERAVGAERSAGAERPVKAERPVSAERQAGADRPVKKDRPPMERRNPDQPKRRPNPGMLTAPAPKKDVKIQDASDLGMNINQSAGDEKW
ncbi:MAG: DEAD/DEAH box helicase [Bacteroidetes bacterium]|nr:DEAD/DEAH box helicase [Bacteroidota bacterium]